MAIAFLVGVAIFTLLDIIEDTIEGSPFLHTLTEAVVLVGCLVFAIYLWNRVQGRWQRRTATLRTRLEDVSADVIKWREETTSLRRGLSTAINRQLDLWKLSTAEKDVALLLLKGFSFKEIAEVRQTSERTVRQQAATIYQKSGLEGRAQLSAFFLEDLLAPIENPGVGMTAAK